MKLRLARHTSDIKRITSFYCDLLDMEIIGEFHDHDGYDGIFIGRRGADWHMEFTTSAMPAKHFADDDDLLVFYVDSDAERSHLFEKFYLGGFKTETPRNPYWKDHGRMYKDPDGYNIIIAKP